MRKPAKALVELDASNTVYKALAASSAPLPENVALMEQLSILDLD